MLILVISKRQCLGDYSLVFTYAFFILFDGNIVVL